LCRLSIKLVMRAGRPGPAEPFDFAQGGLAGVRFRHRLRIERHQCIVILVTGGTPDVTADCLQLG
jgi:hypothetical protein